ncbi:hypothetical protein Tco_0714842, partial [Tanacetum coccineum]
IDQNPSISLVQDEGTSWIQEDAKTQGRTNANTEILLDQEEPTELVEDPGSGEKGKKEISTAEVPISPASAIPVVKAIRLQEQINEEERQRISRDAEIAKQLQEEIDIARQEQEKYDLAQALELKKELDKREEVVAETTQAYDIDWSDPAGGYKQSHFRGMSYEDIRPIFERVWDQNQAFVPKDSEIEKEVMKRPGFDLQQKQPAEEEKLQKNDDSSKPSGGSRKKTLARKRASEKQSEEDGSSKNYKIFSEMIDDFNRQDVMDLHRLVKERYVTTSPEGYDLMLWGDLKTLFEPDEEDEV